MPEYEFECQDCGERFSLEESMSEHEKHEETCPKCGGEQVETLLNPVFVKTSKKS